MVSKVDSNGVFQESFDEKIFGKFTAKDIVKGKEVLFPAGTLIDKIILEEIKKSGIEELAVRSILTCETEGGICQKCYGLDLGYNSIVKIGTPVGIIAAQSIGEPGTQLTMRTFHSG
jgi:DNA-directed RNA polymerase subunit beta'